MKTLNTLVKDFGQPDAVIDHWDKKSKRFAIWGFDEVYSKNSDELNLKHPLREWQLVLDEWKLNSRHSEICAVGGFSYDLKNNLYQNINFKSSNLELPVIWFAKPKIVREFKLEKNNIYYASKLKLIKDIPSIKQYKDDFKIIKHNQQYGNIYQINYTHPKIYRTDNNTFNLYLSLRQIAQPLCGVYINTGEYQFLSASPERFFKRENNTITTFPIKGTRKRSKNPVKDKILAEQLFQSTKDRAEHLMIVDLLRNDLGKISHFGTIKTKNLYQVNSFETVHHMVTEIIGKLKANITESCIIEAMFPGGSITGAPKQMAMKMIDSLEKYNRNFYTGSLGYISPNGNIDMNIAIRTMTIQNSIGIYPVGGGIVWDSEPELEWEEANNKGAIIDNLVKHIEQIKNV